jgi:hypothetical protein
MNEVTVQFWCSHGGGYKDCSLLECEILDPSTKLQCQSPQHNNLHMIAMFNTIKWVNNLMKSYNIMNNKHHYFDIQQNNLTEN